MGIITFLFAIKPFTKTKDNHYIVIKKTENIEILRFLEHGQRVACVKVNPGSIGVDTPEDVYRVEAILAGVNRE